MHETYLETYHFIVLLEDKLSYFACFSGTKPTRPNEWHDYIVFITSEQITEPKSVCLVANLIEHAVNVQSTFVSRVIVNILAVEVQAETVKCLKIMCEWRKFVL